MLEIDKTGKVRINVALNRLHATTFAVEKQRVLQILRACL